MSGGRIAGAIIAFLLGALSVLALPPFSMPWVLPIAFGGLFPLAAGRCRTRAFLAGWAFGAGFFLFGLSWIAESFSVDAEPFGWMAVPALTGLAAALALFPAAAIAAFASTGTDGLSGALVFAACWSGPEWLRGTVLTGFPWNLVGYAWADFDVPRQAAGWIGSYGLGLVTVFLSTLPVVIVLQAKGRRPAILVFAVLTAGVWTAGTVRLAGRQPATEITVRIVQGNIPQKQNWDPVYADDAIETYLGLSGQPGGYDLLLWLETASPGYLDEVARMRERIADVLPEGAFLLTVAPTRERRAGGATDRTSILAIDGAGGIVDRYAKHHLVPFGEYVPLRGILPLERLTAGIGDFTPGDGPATFALRDLPRVRLTICYEAIFPGQVVDPADRPAWIFNATNDAWFGTSIGPSQHLAAARMHAVEEGLPLIRAANAGISAVIDGHGRISSRLGLGARGTLDARLPVALPATPFATFGQAGYVVLLLMFLAGAMGPGLLRRRTGSAARVPQFEQDRASNEGRCQTRTTGRCRAPDHPSKRPPPGWEERQTQRGRDAVQGLGELRWPSFRRRYRSGCRRAPWRRCP